MLCPACSNVVPDHARFCATCGRPIISALSPTFTSPTGAFIPRSIPGEPPRTPGTVLADRYRIVGLLGRGGMGEVYRADDLKLAQPVALKFLPSELTSDPSAVARFHNEVRVARQVSHPNVCRIYDLAEADREPFLSMEYVDGEDLASLLRRIGWLPADKAIQVARQLCAGLSAAHDLGVLHRDLKPANVMLDGRGIAKITDFGLADFVERITAHEFAGTPGYMAPEQLTGGAASIKTDIYALGLVLFEIFTGRPAFIPGSPEDRRRASRDSSPPTPASAQPAIDPTIERVIVRCLDPDPTRRPASARAVAAALPGADPLAAALAAGETPSPEMVAEAGGVGSLRPIVAWSLAATAIAAIVAIALLNDRAALHRMIPGDQSPDVLRARAKSVLARTGHSTRPQDEVHGFDFDLGYSAQIIKDGSTAAWDNVRRGRPPLIRFWYRAGPKPLTPWALGQRSSLSDPPQNDPGSATVVLDPRGRLIRLVVLPASDAPITAAPAAGPDWRPMFEEAGLLESEFTPSKPTRVPPVYADTRAAWAGVFPENPGIPVRIEAAALGGRPVYFDIINPWPEGNVFTVIPTSGLLIIATIVVGLLVAAALLARRNIRLARSDLQSAFRVALFTFLLAIPLFLFGTHHVAAIQELGQLIKAASVQLAFAAGLWLAYVALEPFVRRQWPDLIVSSTRLLAGRVRDPLVGRDLLIGAVFGTVGGLGASLYQVVATASGWPLIHSSTFVLRSVGNQVESLASFSQITSIAVQDALGVMMLLLVLTVVLRRRWVVVPTFFVFVLLVLVFSSPGGPNRWGLILSAVLITSVVVRFGVLAMASQALFHLCTIWLPLTLDLGAFYITASLIPMTMLVGIVWFGLYTSLGGKPLAGWTMNP